MMVDTHCVLRRMSTMCDACGGCNDPDPPSCTHPLHSLIIMNTPSAFSHHPHSKYITSLTALQPNGGIHQFLFHLQRVNTLKSSSARPSKDGNALGKLEIKWRNSMGEVGRLQTQQIVGQSEPRKEVSMQVEHVPGQVQLGQPCCVRVVVRNNVDRRMGPLAVGLTPAGACFVHAC